MFPLLFFARATIVGALTAFAGCSTEDIQPPALVGAGDGAPAQYAATTATAPAETSAPMALASVAPTDQAGTQPALARQQGAVATAARVSFAPVMSSGPVDVATLSGQLARRAGERGLPIAQTGDPGASHTVKGYLSTLTEAGGTTVIYVWDVFDRSGTRVHRIQGKETAKPGAEQATMSTIALRTVDDLAGWLAPRG